jgi:hypothetical protein
MPKVNKTKKINSPDIQQQVDKLLLDIKKITNKATAKYKSFDAPTKQKIVAGVGLLAALVAGATLLKKTKKRK